MVRGVCGPGLIRFTPFELAPRRVTGDRARRGHLFSSSVSGGAIGQVAHEVIDEVAIALPIKSQYTQIESAVALLEEQGITTHLLSDFFPQKLASLHPLDFDGMPIVSLRSAPPFSWRTEAKRLIDLAVAWVFLMICAPLFALVAIAIKLESKGPVFFIQERVGLSKRRFRMIK